MATYLVTGGLGFIGSHVVDALAARGDAVRVLDNLSSGHRENVKAPIDLIVGDVVDAELTRRAMTGVDGCFHFAAIASVARCNDDWLNSHQVNQSGAVSVFQAALQANSTPVPVVYASSAAVYGDNSELPLAETAPPRPLSPYGADKLGTEFQARAGGRVHGLPSLGARLFNVYGPRQDPASPYSGVISIFMDRIRRGEEVVVYGDGGQTRDFVYIDDVVQCLLRGLPAASADAPVVNICGGISCTINDLLAIMMTAADRTVTIRHAAARAGDIRESRGCPDRAVELLGLRPSIRLNDGIARLLKA